MIHRASSLDVRRVTLKGVLGNMDQLEKQYFQQLIIKRSLLLKSIVNKIATLMIKKDQHHDIDKKIKTKPILHTKYVDQQTGSDTPKKTFFKHRFIQWLKQLPLDERYLAVKVHAPGLSKKLQETLVDLQNEPIQQGKKICTVGKKISHRQAKQIIDSIVLISDGEEYFGNIGFDFTYVEHPDKLYELLASNLSQQQKLMYQSQQYQIETLELKEVCNILERSQSKEQLSLALISYLRGQIFCKYEFKTFLNLQEERSRKKEFSMFWRNLSEQNKLKILLLNKENYFALSTYLAQLKILLSPDELQRECTQLIQMEKNQFCNKIFKCKLKKSLTYFIDYYQLIYQLWKTELNKRKRKHKNHKTNNLQKPSCSFNRSSFLQTNEKPPRRPNFKNQKQHFKTETTLHTQKNKNHPLTTNLHQQKPSKHSHNNNPNTINQNHNELKAAIHTNFKATISQKNNKGTFAQHINLLTVPQNDQTTTTTSTKRKRNRNRRKKSVSAQSKETNTTNHRFEKQEKQEYERKIQEETSIASQHIIDGISSQTFKTESTLPCTISSYVSESIQYLSLQEVDIPKIDFLGEIFSKVKSDIQQYSDLINQQANEFYERRVVAYERIQFMLGMWKIPIKLFGSCASGITIKNSDIDIAVDNSILNYFLYLSAANRLRGALQQLQQLLQQQPWVAGLKLIKTAAIPLIKLKVDTSIDFVPMPGIQIYQPYIDNLNRKHLSSGQIHIDLTIETINEEQQCSHLGIISTDHINSWLKSIKSLHPIVIIIKNSLTKTNLNITYEGGLNTYSMICMLVAFIKQQKLDEETDAVIVLQKILKFYAFQFDEKTTGIDLLNPKDIFYNKLKLISNKSASSQDEPKLPDLTQSKSTPVFCKADLEIKDPLNDGKNMTKNCYSFPKIRQIFRQIYSACFQEQTLKLQQIFKQEFKSRYSRQQIKQTLKIDSKEVRELLEQCKLKLSNPFLTLFE